jgi:hypothetical protein
MKRSQKELVVEEFDKKSIEFLGTSVPGGYTYKYK